MSETIRFELPCHVFIARKKKGPKVISLNMNWYRNAFHYDLNKVKQAYKPDSGELFKANKIAISYTLHLPNNRRTDLMNWIAIADKFFLDWLVGQDCIEDDGIKQYAKSSSEVGDPDPARGAYITADVEILERRSA